jgi:hypothetical protein
LKVILLINFSEKGLFLDNDGHSAVQEIPSSYTTRKLITIATKALYQAIFFATSMQFTI